MNIFFSDPLFFPPLNFFYGLLNSQLWAVMDHLPFEPRTWQNQCRIKTSTGVQWLRVTVNLPCTKPVHQVTINNARPWKQSFFAAINRVYGDSEYYPIYIDDLKFFVEGPCVLLETLNVQTTLWIAGLLKKRPNLFYTKSVYTKYPASKVVKTVCKRFDGTVFEGLFSEVSLDVYDHDPSGENLSVLDALFTVGAEGLRALIKTKGKTL